MKAGLKFFTENVWLNARELAKHKFHSANGLRFYWTSGWGRRGEIKKQGVITLTDLCPRANNKSIKFVRKAFLQGRIRKFSLLPMRFFCYRKALHFTIRQFPPCCSRRAVLLIVLIITFLLLSLMLCLIIPRESEKQLKRYLSGKAFELKAKSFANFIKRKSFTKKGFARQHIKIDCRVEMSTDFVTIIWVGKFTKCKFMLNKCSRCFISQNSSIERVSSWNTFENETAENNSFLNGDQALSPTV